MPYDLVFEERAGIKVCLHAENKLL